MNSPFKTLTNTMLAASVVKLSEQLRKPGRPDRIVHKDPEDPRIRQMYVEATAEWDLRIRALSLANYETMMLGCGA